MCVKNEDIMMFIFKTTFTFLSIFLSKLQLHIYLVVTKADTEKHLDHKSVTQSDTLDYVLRNTLQKLFYRISGTRTKQHMLCKLQTLCLII